MYRYVPQWSSLNYNLPKWFHQYLPCKTKIQCISSDQFTCNLFACIHTVDCGIPKCIKCDVVSNKCLQCQEGYKVNENYDDDDDDDAQCVGQFMFSLLEVQ